MCTASKNLKLKNYFEFCGKKKPKKTNKRKKYSQKRKFGLAFVLFKKAEESEHINSILKY